MLSYQLLESVKDCELVIVAVAHKEYKSLSAADYQSMLTSNGSLFDIKGILPREELKSKKTDVWRI